MGEICEKFSRLIRNDDGTQEGNSINDQKNMDIIQNQHQNNPYFSMDKNIKEINSGKENMEIYQIITNIQQNNEIDETKGLSIYHIKDYIDSIFPDNFPKNIIRDITSQIREMIKGIENKNEIKYIFEINNINTKESFYFLCGIKKDTEDTINIAYKFKVLNINISKIKISDKRLKSEGNFNYNNEEQLIHNAINNEKNKLKKYL